MTQLVNQNQTQAPLERRHRFTVQEFEQMGKTGVLYGRKVELLDGEIIDMNADGDGHSAWTGSLTERLVLAFQGKARVIPQQTMRLIEDFYMPVPDFTVTPLERYQPRVVRSDEISIAIEISDSTLSDDRTYKQKLYARNGVLEYWILNVQAGQLEVYRDRENDTYNTKFTLSKGQTITPLEFPEVSLEWWT
jgi:Uma2 family endonuclease